MEPSDGQPKDELTGQTSSLLPGHSLGGHYGHVIEITPRPATQASETSPATCRSHRQHPSSTPLYSGAMSSSGLPQHPSQAQPLHPGLLSGSVRPTFNPYHLAQNYGNATSITQFCPPGPRPGYSVPQGAFNPTASLNGMLPYLALMQPQLLAIFQSMLAQSTSNALAHMRSEFARRKMEETQMNQQRQATFGTGSGQHEGEQPGIISTATRAPAPGHFRSNPEAFNGNPAVLTVPILQRDNSKLHEVIDLTNDTDGIVKTEMPAVVANTTKQTRDLHTPSCEEGVLKPLVSPQARVTLNEISVDTGNPAEPRADDSRNNSNTAVHEQIPAIFKQNATIIRSRADVNVEKTSEFTTMFKEPSAKKVYSCEWCPFKSTKGGVTKHLQAHQPVTFRGGKRKPFKCLDCKLYYLLLNHVEDHLNGPRSSISDHRIVELEDTYLTDDEFVGEQRWQSVLVGTCDLCGFKTSQRRLKHHKLSHTQDEERAYACDDCKMYFAEMGQLVRHKNLRHGLTLAKVATVKYQKKWSVLNSRIKKPNKSKVKYHRLKDASAKRLECRIRNTKVENNPPLGSAQYTEELIKKSDCLICGTHLKSTTLLDIHMLTHQPLVKVTDVSKHLRCDLCLIELSDLSAYTDHMINGHTRTPWAHFAEHSYAQRNVTPTATATVSKPTAENTEEKKVETKCRLCGSATSDLRKHMMSHDPENRVTRLKKPYQCKQCACFFMKRLSLRRHVDKCH